MNSVDHEMIYQQLNKVIKSLDRIGDNLEFINDKLKTQNLLGDDVSIADSIEDISNALWGNEQTQSIADILLSEKE